MGTTYVRLTAPGSFCEQGVVCISPHGSDILRVFNLSDQGMERLSSAITSTWSRGIKSGAWQADKLYEFRFHGNPWPGAGAEAIQSRRLMVGIFRCMLGMGYGLALSPNVSKRQGAKDAWVFLQRFDSWRCSDPRDIFAISFNRANRIRIIDAKDEITALITHVAGRYWRKGTAKIGSYEGVPEIELAGSPWDANGKDSTANRVLVAQLVAGLAGAGYTVYASLASERGNGCRPDSWVVVKNPPTLTGNT
ncbi:hypothetical protein CBR_g29294 [Chara braunii]|uniref:Uncharacterized protein n=1 Tax=Chara braunii TaxID=69332 RepID=A0A388LAN7_CHABU|nr:hypothetical protein CBR_g29294 [Chara braunii]|eukprot:GBG79243.1 hypothetical protein CBR_g29294 [Chara braunii]